MHPAKSETTTGKLQVVAEDGKADLRRYSYKPIGGKNIKLAAESYIANHKYILDEAVFEDNASILIPKAVNYSAGLLNYFFRGGLGVISDPDGLKIKNINDEVMENGTIFHAGFRWSLENSRVLSIYICA